jgi:hypothetical protein
MGWGLRTGGVEQFLMREVRCFQSSPHAVVRNGPLVLGILGNLSEESDDRPRITQ